MLSCVGQWGCVRPSYIFCFYVAFFRAFNLPGSAVFHNCAPAPALPVETRLSEHLLQISIVFGKAVSFLGHFF